MLTPAERTAMIARLRSFPAELEKTLVGWTDAELDRTPEGEWSARQIVHHLSDSHMNAFIRTKLILTEDHPTLRPYDQVAWAKTAETRGASLEAPVSILKGLHERWVALLESLPESSFQRAGFHPEMKQDVSLDDILGIYSKHGSDHIAQMLRAREGKA
jgi:DinB family protein